MAKSPSAMGFRFMRIAFAIRDFLIPRMLVLEEIGIPSGSVVLDYGCGSGSYIVPLLSIIGETGKIYALDVHPLSIQTVKDICAQGGLKNVETILSDCQTGLPDQSVDVILLYDIYHDLENAGDILQELNRVLKPEGMLSFSDHHMKAAAIEEKFTGHALFRIDKKHKKTYTLVKSQIA